MRRKSHTALGQFLLREYMPHLPRRYARLFLIGCIQPDGNPSTYLKGSLRSQWLRGHNYSNASRFIHRLATRLERKEAFSAWDFYSLGKLIHYTMDAFTYPHNEHFGPDLKDHRVYEVHLQHYFLVRLSRYCPDDVVPAGSAADFIRQSHDEYLSHPGTIETDTDYALRICTGLIKKLAENIRECQEKRFLSESENVIMI